MSAGVAEEGGFREEEEESSLAKACGWLVAEKVCHRESEKAWREK